MTIQWTDDLSINIGNLDVQHKEIFKRYDMFIGACKEGKGKEQLVDLLDFLNVYVYEHFEHEEALMKEYAYPAFEAHCKEHLKLMQTVQKFRTRLMMVGANVGLLAEVNNVLQNWLIDHIKKTDMELGGYLNEKWGLF